MASVRNILFLMCDQLRVDYLSCYGADRPQTPNIDRLAARGTRFTRAYVQSPVCGPSRMSFYTGRYVFSHGSTWNFVPLPVGERTIGDYLRPLGLRVAVVGKTHVAPDLEGVRRLGLSPDEGAGRLIAQGGFEPFARDDGLHPDQRVPPDLPYNTYLRAHGMNGANPWHDWANSGTGADGELASGWYLRNSGLAARVPDEHSESAYTTDQAIRFVQEQGDAPWCLHVSYIKPHWPYIVSAPYHAMYREGHSAPVRAPAEREDPHPVLRGFQAHSESQTFSREEPRRNAVGAYMGLMRQLDHHIGRLLDFLDAGGRSKDTLIVLTSDHGDFLGDHWLGDKEFMYEQAVRVPLIVAEPGGERRTSTALVEAVDLLPTFIEALGAKLTCPALEGRSLLGHMRSGARAPERDAVFSELDYSIHPAARQLGLGPNQARMTMVRTQRWKLVHFDGFPPQLFDLENDPLELRDLGRQAGNESVKRELADRMFEWMHSRRNRIAMSDEVAAARAGPGAAGGVVIGQW